ncbi:MAG: hypothetical protein LBK99_12155 [Opitutaceae bacterium]|jgi:hypothetical protein|nr:hypothetical protein [Opitutaceae bacterium]
MFAWGCRSASGDGVVLANFGIAAVAGGQNRLPGKVADCSARASGVPGKVAAAGDRTNRKRVLYGSGGVSRLLVTWTQAGFEAPESILCQTLRFFDIPVFRLSTDDFAVCS